MKQIIELNGVANIDLMLQVEVDIKGDKAEMNIETFASIKKQLVLIERYMLAYNKAVHDGTQTPMWHEVYTNPHLYPTNRERID